MLIRIFKSFLISLIYIKFRNLIACMRSAYLAVKTFLRIFCLSVYNTAFKSAVFSANRAIMDRNAFDKTGIYIYT